MMLSSFCEPLLFNNSSDDDDAVITINHNADNYIRCLLTDDVDDKTEKFKWTSLHKCTPDFMIDAALMAVCF